MTKHEKKEIHHLKKEVTKEAKLKGVNSKPRSQARKGGSRGMSLDGRGARDTAFCTLNPDAAEQYELSPGICDSQLHQEMIVYTTTKVTFGVPVNTGGSSAYATRVAVYPCLSAGIMYSTTNAADTPDSGTASYVDDIMYTSLGTNSNYYTVIGMCATLRCLDPPLSLSGSRQFTLGDGGMAFGTYASVTAREDSIFMGNNKAGDILRGLWVPKTPFELRAIADTPSASTGAIIMQVLPGNTASSWELCVYRVVAAQSTRQNTLVPLQPFVANAAEYSEIISRSFARQGLYSQSRCVYSDDGWFSSLWNDVKGVLGGAASSLVKYATPKLQKFGEKLIDRGENMANGLLGATRAADPPVTFQSACLLSQMSDEQLQAVIALCALDSTAASLRGVLNRIIHGASAWRAHHGLRADKWPTLMELKEFEDAPPTRVPRLSIEDFVHSRTISNEPPSPVASSTRRSAGTSWISVESKR